MVSGIYIIKNKVNGKFYVGSSCNCEERFTAHKILLRKGEHHSVVLQRAWNKYGEKNFIFKVIEECCEERLLEREQFYIDNFNPHYNTNQFADKPPTKWGLNHPMSNLTKKKLYDIRVRLMEGASARSVAMEFGVGHRQVLQIAHKISYPNEPGPEGWDTWQFERGKRRVSNSRLGKNKVMEIRERLMKGELVKDLAVEYGVHQTTINKIAQGKTWKGVMPNGFEEWRDTWQYESGKRRVSNSKLDENKVMEIRKRLMKGELIKDLAAEYGVYLTAVNKIAQGKTWKGVMPNGFKEWRDARKRR